MMPVGDVNKRDSRELFDDPRCFDVADSPDRVADSVGRGEIIKRVFGLRARDDFVDLSSPAIRQKNRTRLRSKRNHMTRPVVLFVFAGALVPANDVRVVLIDRATAGDAGLLLLAHAQAIDVQAWRV